MAYTREELIDIGVRINTPQLIQWAGVVVKLARRDAGKLSNRGITADFLNQLDNLRKEVQSLEKQQKIARGISLKYTAQQDEVFKNAAAWRREVRELAKVAFEGEPDVLAEFRSGVKVWRSVPKLLGELSRLIELCKKYSSDLSPLGMTPERVKEGEALLEQLRTVDQEQEKARKDIPATTLELSEKKARLYQGVRRIVRLARVELGTEEASKRGYNYDIMRRIKSARKAARTRAAKRASRS